MIKNAKYIYVIRDYDVESNSNNYGVITRISEIGICFRIIGNTNRFLRNIDSIPSYIFINSDKYKLFNSKKQLMDFVMVMSL